MVFVDGVFDSVRLVSWLGCMDDEGSNVVQRARSFTSHG
jgi:hypothetical protein